MSRFLITLSVTLLDDAANGGRGRWRLDHPLAYESDVAGQAFIVPEGFETDFASVPRIPGAFWLFGDMAHQAAVIHDWLYTEQPVSREMADDVLREAALVCGVSAWRAHCIWAGVRVGGQAAWDRAAPV